MTASDRREFLSLTARGTAAAIALQPALLGAPLVLPNSLRLGVVGTGKRGRQLLDELATFPALEIVGLCDVVPGRLKGGLRRAQGAKGFADHRALLDETKPDLVFVATPTHAHLDVVRNALEAGAHVYCETPLAHTADDARAIAAAAQAASTTFQSGLVARSNPIYQLARSFYRSGSIRDTVAIRAHHHEKSSWRATSSDPAYQAALDWKLDPELSLGLAGELGTHQFDVARYFTGRTPRSVRGFGSVLAWKDGREVADSVSCDLVDERGITCSWNATLGNSFEGEVELFAGTMGSIKLAETAGWLFKEADAPTQGWEVYANRQKFHGDEGITLIADATKLAAQGQLAEGVGLPHSPLWYALESFLKSVARGEEVRATADDGLQATLVGIAAHRAVVSGERVEVG